jgi:hypothetical protein
VVVLAVTMLLVLLELNHPIFLVGAVVVVVGLVLLAGLEVLVAFMAVAVVVVLQVLLQHLVLVVLVVRAQLLFIHGDLYVQICID